MLPSGFTPDGNPLRHLALLLIRAYQRYLSPYKGFCCAYRRHTGRGSCSALGYRAIRRHGIFSGLGILRERTWRCGVAHRRFSLPSATRLPAAQRGFCDGCDLPCDLSCDGCDLPCDLGDLCDPGDCCSCDWPTRKRQKQKGGEDAVHLPAARWKSGAT